MKRAITALMVIAALIVAVVELTADDETQPLCIEHGAVPEGHTKLAEDCQTLLGMKGALGGTGDLNWWSARSIWEWDGIYVAVEQDNLIHYDPNDVGVFAIFIEDIDLGGSIPESIGNLTHLEILGFLNTNLTGEIPKSLVDLPLAVLILSGNSFTGCLPPELLSIEETDVDTLGLQICANGDGPVLPPPPGDDEVTELLDVAMCAQEDIEDLFGQARHYFDYMQHYEFNGRGVLASMYSEWHVSPHYDNRQITCVVEVFQNPDSAKIDFYQTTPEDVASGFYLDILHQRNIPFWEFNENNLPVGDAVQLALGYRSPDFIGPKQTYDVLERVETVYIFHRRNLVVVITESYDLGDVELTPDLDPPDYFYPPHVYNVAKLAEKMNERLDCYYPNSPCQQPSTDPEVIVQAARERAILIAFYEATGGPNWKINNRWLSDNPVSEWYGVFANVDELVGTLQITDNSLTGAISPELGNLSILENLNLSGNQLEGSIPAELGNLSGLRFLALDGNRLSGAIPPELGNLSNLLDLGLSRNPDLSGPLPDSLTKLTSLERLFLDETQVCVPRDDAFKAWLDNIEYKQGVVYCPSE